MKVFKQEVLPTSSLNDNYERQLSVSPLKYRPEVNWEGFEDIRPSGQKNTIPRSTKKRVMTPDLVHTTPGKSMSPENHGFARKRSNSRKSILKSNRSAHQMDCVSPSTPNTQAQLNQPNFILPASSKNTVSFADLTNRNKAEPVIKHQS